ncbi:uncharacterized protein LW93_13061 [Fusarium fujikuroi]|nr:uncharacterized protein LW93_13061 [Fusarium fujikuroi]
MNEKPGSGVIYLPLVELSLEDQSRWELDASDAGSVSATVSRQHEVRFLCGRGRGRGRGRGQGDRWSQLPIDAAWILPCVCLESFSNYPTIGSGLKKSDLCGRHSKESESKELTVLSPSPEATIRSLNRHALPVENFLSVSRAIWLPQSQAPPDEDDQSDGSGHGPDEAGPSDAPPFNILRHDVRGRPADLIPTLQGEEPGLDHRKRRPRMEHRWLPIFSDIPETRHMSLIIHYSSQIYRPSHMKTDVVYKTSQDKDC